MSSKETARQWLKWVGALYQEAIADERPADQVVTRRMRVEGRRWGHDARRWVSSAAYAMARQRPRTLWFWALALENSPGISRELEILARQTAPSPQAKQNQKPPEEKASPVRSATTESSLPQPLLALDVARARHLGVLPPLLNSPAPFSSPHPGAVPAENANKTMEFAAAWLESSPPPLDLPEAAVAWAARGAGGPLDHLARALRAWVGTLDPEDELAALAEGAAGRPWCAGLARAILQFAGEARATPPPDAIARETQGDSRRALVWEHSLPWWMSARLRRRLDDDEVRALAATFEQPAPVYLRVNSLKAAPDEAMRQLREEKYHVQPMPPVPNAVLVVHRANLFRSRAFEQGLFEVQDISSQIVGLALGPRPGERVLDYCAGAGGKTLQLGALMENRGVIWALDVDAGRLARLRERASHAGLFTIRRALIDPFSEEELQAARALLRGKAGRAFSEDAAKNAAVDEFFASSLAPGISPRGLTEKESTAENAEKEGKEFTAESAENAERAESVRRARAVQGAENSQTDSEEVPESIRRVLGIDAPDLSERDQSNNEDDSGADNAPDAFPHSQLTTHNSQLTDHNSPLTDHCSLPTDHFFTHNSQPTTHNSSLPHPTARRLTPRRAARAPGDLPMPTERELRHLREQQAQIPNDFHAVLVDAPCSGSGVYRRRPDASWRLTPEMIERHRLEQALILRAASRRVAPGGRLLYATCSIFPEENEEQVAAFLEDSPEFEPGDLAAALEHWGLGAWSPGPGAFQTTLLPTRLPGDGFFMALLRRKPQ